MYAGRAGRDYITRDHPDNRGHELGIVTGQHGAQLEIEVSHEVAAGDGIAFEPPDGDRGAAVGFTVTAVRTIDRRDGRIRQVIEARRTIPVGWRVVRSSEAALLQQARASFSGLPSPRERKSRLDVRLFGRAGAPLKAVFCADGEQVEARSEIALSAAQARPLDESKLREQLGRLGGTPFALGSIDMAGVARELFLPVSELNRLRQQAVDELMARRTWANDAASAERSAAIQAAVATLPEARVRAIVGSASAMRAPEFTLSVDCYRIEDALAAANGGATEVALDPFLRHPMPPVSRVKSLASELAARGVAFRLRTPNILRPEERHLLDKWLALGLPVVSGHAGLAVELASQGIDVVADYAINCFNQHTAAEFFSRGISRIVASIELTADEIAQLVSPWDGNGFDVVVYGRPEGMTLEHCVLSAAFNREPTTCRDLCVQKHPVVSLTDPAGYTFPVATDFACRNRLLHSRPIEGSEFIPRLWRSGLRGYRAIFNVPGLPVEALVRGYRMALEALGSDDRPDLAAVRDLVEGEFTRGHFATAV
jgi:putative protease